MKRFFRFATLTTCLLLCVICGLYGLSEANNFGSSVEGEKAAVTFTHTADCDSAHASFGYDGDGGADTLNFYVTVDLVPCFSGDGMILMGEGLDLDSIGTHVVKITYFEDDGNATADGYVAGIWMHENPNLTGLAIWTENLSGYVTANWAGTYLRSLAVAQDWDQWDNPTGTDTLSGMGKWFADWFKADHWLTATGFSTHGASDVAALWGDTLTYLIAFRDSVENAITATNKANFKADVEDIRGSVEPSLNRLNIYVDIDGNGDNDGLTWATAVCSLRTAESKCTGADEYFIYIAPGNYATQSCSITVFPLTIEGAGWDRTILNGVTGASIIHVEHAGRGFKVSGLSFIHDTNSRGIYLRDIEGFEISDCYFEKCYMGIFDYVTGEKGRINDVFIYASSYDGVRVDGDKVWIDHIVVDSISESGGDGIALLGKYCTASNNIVKTTVGHCLLGRTGSYGDNAFINNYLWHSNSDNLHHNIDHSQMVANREESKIASSNTLDDDIYVVYAEADSSLHAMGYDFDSTLLTFLRYIRNNQDDYKATGFSTHGASDVATLWGDTLNQLLVTIDSVIASTGYDADTTLLTFLRYTRNNQSDYKATGFATHSAADVKTLWGDTLTQLLVTIDSIITATGFDPDSTVLAFLRYIRNNQADYKADVSGLSTFDHTSDKVTLVDTSAGDISYTKNNPDVFKATIPDSTTIYYADKMVMSHIVYETLYVHRTDFQGGGGDSINIYYADKRVIAHVVYETLYVHANDFKSTGFAVAGDAMTLQDDSLQTLMGDVDDIKAKTDKLIFNVEDSLIVDYSNMPTGGGADLSDEVDSILAVLYDRTNDSNFVRLIAHLLLHDSVTIDNSNAWDLSGGTDLSNEVDSLLAVLYDRTNDSNFVRLIAHLILHDSVTIDNSNAWDLRGEAAGLTASELADTLANRGYVSGGGVFACSVITKLDSDSSVLPGIHVIARSADQTSPLAHGYTDANGQKVFGLDSMATGYTHKFWLINVDYSFSFPESADVNTDTTLTFYGSAFDYGDPPPDSQCAVYGQIFNPLLDSLSGVIISAKVYVPGDSLLTYKGYPISPFTVSDTTEVDGRFRLDLIPNDMFLPVLPETTAYIFNFKYPSPWGGYSPPQDQDTLKVLKSYLPSITYGELKGR